MTNTSDLTPAQVHPDFVVAAAKAIQAAAGVRGAIEFHDEIRIGLAAALPLIEAKLRAEMEFDHMLARRQAVLEVVGQRDHWRSLAVTAQARVAQIEGHLDADARAVAATLRWIRAEIGGDRRVLGAIREGAWTDLEDRFVDRIAEVERRDTVRAADATET